MNYYFDIIMQADEDIPIFHIRNKAYDKLHKAMYDLNSKNIGISFPNKHGEKDKNLKLGDTIRLHGGKESLEKLQNLNYLSSLSDYCKTSKILPIPSEIKGHQVISRIRQTMNESKLRKRVAYQKEKGILKTEDEAKAYIKQYKDTMFKQSLREPYLEIPSTSTKNRYRIYLKFKELQDKENIGEFNQFGISKESTVPVFWKTYF